MPWEMSPEEVRKASGETALPAEAKEVKSDKKPWEMALDEIRSFFKGNPRQSDSVKNIPPKETNSPYDFDTVFNRLIKTESGGKHTVDGELITSKAGAKGITQVLPKTASDPGYGVEPIKDKSEAEYKRFGRDYLKAMLKEFDGDYEKALAAYNAGVGNVKKAISKDPKNWKEYLPRTDETLPYIKKILEQK